MTNPLSVQVKSFKELKKLTLGKNMMISKELKELIKFCFCKFGLLDLVKKRKKSILDSIPKYKISETSKCRNSLAPYCQGNGLDIGFGGDPIKPNAICLDLPERYAKYGNSPQHLHGDARYLTWFRDNSLDYVFSSHVLEDFEDTLSVFKEWMRVIKPSGKLILFLPDEKTYRQFCVAKGRFPNSHHKHSDFSPEYMKAIIKEYGYGEVIHENFPVGIYSFEMVVKKLRCDI